MAKYLASMTKCSSATNLDTVTNGNVNGHSDHSPTAYASCNGKEGEMDPSTWSTIRTVEMQQLQRAKSEFELMADKLRADLKMQRILESELRSQLTQLQNDCHSHRGEASQSKSKVEQLEGKCKNLAKQNETMRANFASLEKRAGEVQARKAELERELASERSNNAKQVKEDMWSSKSNEFSDPTALIQSLKSKSASLEREMKGLRRELRSKEDQVTACRSFCVRIWRVTIEVASRSRCLHWKRT
jgi:chromosome segregation ATPase